MAKVFLLILLIHLVVANPTAHQWMMNDLTGKQYKVLENVNRPLSLDASQHLCASEGGMLPEPKNELESFFLSELYGGSMILGMTARQGQWRWESDGAEVTWFKWQDWGYGEDSEHADCAYIIGNGLHQAHDPTAWIKQPCSGDLFIRTNGLVCQKATSTPQVVAQTPTTTETSCAQGFTRFDGVCYGLFKEKKSWNDAQASCKAKGGILAEPKSAGEVELVRSFTIENGGKTPWIGGTKRGGVSGVWVWADSGASVQYTDWYLGEPNNGLGNEFCLSLNQWYDWNDAPCDLQEQYICQM